jgi:hypothetical protein
MSDWDFLYDMHDQGYSADAIADAAGSGASPEEWEHIARQEALADEPEEQQNLMALDSLERLRQAGSITREQFLECKAAILK